MVPSVGINAPPITCSKVLLPLPFGPRIAVRLPLASDEVHTAEDHLTTEVLGDIGEATCMCM